MRPQLPRSVVVVTTWARWRTTELSVWGMNIFKGVWEEKGHLGSFLFYLIFLSKMVLETRGIKPKRISICQSGCFRSVTLDFSVLTWLGWHDIACYGYCSMCNVFSCTTQGVSLHFLLACPNYARYITFRVSSYFFHLSSLKAKFRRKLM